MHVPFAYGRAMQEVLEQELDEADAFHDREEAGGTKDGIEEELAAEKEIQEAVFMSSYIPRSLHEVRKGFSPSSPEHTFSSHLCRVQPDHVDGAHISCCRRTGIGGCSKAFILPTDLCLSYALTT